MDPALDRFVLIHALCNDAREIAVSSDSKTDLEKGADSDSVASEFAEIVKDLLERIPYLDVAVSTLLPRFDDEDRAAMSCPNNVRKVMNVEISSRLHDVPRVTLVNNDAVLQWWDDDVKKMRLFGSDGHHLTPYGFSVMLDHWMVTLRQLVSDADVSPDDDAVEDVTEQLSAVTTASDEFHDANEEILSESGHQPLVDDSSTEKDEFREKENEEKMEKEL